MRTSTRTPQRDGGFSLIEILIVIVVLGVLATVTVFAVRGITDRGEQASCDGDRRVLHTATESYFAQWGGTEILTTAPTSPAAPAEMAAAIAAGDVTLGATPQGTLQGFGLVNETSTLFDVDNSGVVAPSAGSRC